MSDDELKKWQIEWKRYAEREAKLPPGQHRRVLENERREAHGQGVWREIVHRHQLRFGEQANQVIGRVRRRLKPWASRLAPEDYNFGERVDEILRWPKEEQRLRLGAFVIYEYTRESYKLRGLLTLLNPPDRGRKKNGICPEAFEGLDAATAEKALGGWFAILLELADELAANVPFALVKPERIDRALFHREVVDGKSLRRSRLESEIGQTVRFVPPVAPAFENFRFDAAGHETMLSWWMESRGEKSKWKSIPASKRMFHCDHKRQECEEILLVRINWRDYSNKELGDAFTAFVRRYRPHEKFPEPATKTGPGKGRDTQLFKHLTALCALRLANAFPFKAAEEMFRKAKAKLASPEAALLEPRKFDAKCREAEKTFATHFPFGETPYHFARWGFRQGRN